MYRNYFLEKEESQKFYYLAQQFLVNYLESGAGQRKLGLNPRLCVTLTEEEKKKYIKQIESRTINGMSIFKPSSEVQGKWSSDVCSQINFKNHYATTFWYIPALRAEGKHELVDYSGDVYGMISTRLEKDICIQDYMEEISIQRYTEIKKSLKSKG